MQSLDANGFQYAAQALADAARELAQLGWTPATSSNFSSRIDATTAAITISGRDKGRLGVDDFMVVDFEGRAVGSDHRPSAETLLHTQLYAHDAGIGCVLHTHSRTQTVASRLFRDRGEITLAGYELLKAFRGYDTHEATMHVPVLPNSQDMHALATMIEPFLNRSLPLHGYLIDGHGIYAWGRDLKEARRHLDAFEFLLSCELDLWNLRR
ncbi:MAG TPA: methylthioribulose 1-phosphate dehydratase [Patescibacteria group bacterium]|nr:methylthioribulose 1-phosphate dehydratase [Patescibacteria group bacterium]